MSDIKIPREPASASMRAFLQELDGGRHLDLETRQLLHMAGQLSVRDRVALSHIIRRAGEICDSDGEDVALAVLDQIGAILQDRRLDS